MPTTSQLVTSAEVILSAFTDQMIRDMHATPLGEDILRRIVRDDISGAGEKVTAALWPTI